MQTPGRAQYRVLPRMTALSEVLWSGPGINSYDDFYGRLIHLQDRFDELDWAHAPGSFLVSIQTEQENENKGIRVQLTSEKPAETILFTMDGSDPTAASVEYKSAFTVDNSTTIKAALFIRGKPAGQISEKTIYFHKAVGKSVDYKTKYQKKYPGNGPSSLVNGTAGSTNYNDGFWQGWEWDDLDVVIDLGVRTEVNQIICGFLEAQNSWIFLPTEIRVSFSDNDTSFKNIRSVVLSDGENYSDANRV